MVLLAHVSTALGAGKITGLTLNPPDVKTCTFETITVRGTGKCSDVTVFFGDGNKLITLGKPKPFPQTFHHVYSKGGGLPGCRRKPTRVRAAPALARPAKRCR
jgi:hypothetical protein